MRAAGILLHFCLLASTLAFDCSLSPIYIDLHDRDLDGSAFKEYGSFIGVGTPSQNQSLWPALSHNETTLASVQFCSQGSSPACGVNTHSFFAPELSNSWQDTPEHKYLDSEMNPDGTVARLGNDTLNLFVHYLDPSPPTVTHVPSSPVNVLSNYTSSTNPFFGPSGLLGLGPASTILQDLYSRAMISSRSFGLYLGTGYPRASGAVNGSLTLGGYDAGRFEGPVYNYSMANSTAEPLKLSVHVSQISLASVNGRDTVLDLVDSQSSFDAEITTLQYPLTLPKSVTQMFASALSAQPSNNSDNSLRTAVPFLGSLTITLSNGFSVSFPSDWVSNATNITPVSADPLKTSPSSTVNATDTNVTSANASEGPFFLGTAFLSFVYLAVNYDSSPPTFHLARALPDAPYVYATTLCPNTAPTPFQASANRVSSFAKAGGAGAIVGGVIGGIAVALVVYVVVRKVLANRSMKKKREMAGLKVPAKQGGDGGDWEGELEYMEPVTPGWPIGSGAVENEASGAYGGRYWTREEVQSVSSLRSVTPVERV